MANRTIFRQLSNDYRYRPRGQGLIRPIFPILSPVAFKIGDMDSFTHTPDIQRIAVNSNEFPLRQKVLDEIISADINIGFVARQLTEVLSANRFLAKKEKLAQAAAQDLELTADAAADTVIRLPRRDVTVNEVTSGSTPYVLGVNYAVDSESGRVEILKHPDGVVADEAGYAPVKVAYDAALIAGRTMYGLNSLVEQRFEITLLQNMSRGIQHEVIYHNVQLSPEGDVGLIADGDDFSSQQFTGACYPDETQPAGHEIATVIERRTRV